MRKKSKLTLAGERGTLLILNFGQFFYRSCPIDWFNRDTFGINIRFSIHLSPRWQNLILISIHLTQLSKTSCRRELRFPTLLMFHTANSLKRSLRTSPPTVYARDLYCTRLRLFSKRNSTCRLFFLSWKKSFGEHLKTSFRNHVIGDLSCLWNPTLAGQPLKNANLFDFFRRMHVFYRKIVSLIARKNGKMASVYQPEPSVEDVIGDATWRPANHASLWFVKNNVLVYVMDGSLLHNQLTLTRSVARKIEAKINAGLLKK